MAKKYKLNLDNSMTKKLFLLVALICLKNTSQAQLGGYNINGTIKGIEQDSVFLGYRYGNSNFLIDTAVVNKASGEFVFSNKNALPSGLYFLMIPNQGTLDLILNETQNFSFKTDVSALQDKMQFIDCNENTQFYRYILEVSELQNVYQQQLYNNQLIQRATHNDKEIMAQMKLKIDTILAQIDSVSDAFKINYPNNFFSQILIHSQNVTPPDSIQQKKPNGSFNPNYYFYLKNHYWDDFNFQDPRLLRSSVWSQRLDYYFNKVLQPNADTIIGSIDVLMLQLGGIANKPYYQAFISWITAYYETSSRMGDDAIVVHMIDKYHNSNDANWLSEATLLQLQEKANLLRNNLIGKIGKPISLIDTAGNMQNLYDIKAPFTLLYFYSTQCQHCAETTPGVYTTFQKYEKLGLKGYAVCTDPFVDLLKQYVQKFEFTWVSVLDPEQNASFNQDYAAYNLPVIYLLDANKRIVAKRVKPEKLDSYLEAAFQSLQQK